MENEDVLDCDSIEAYWGDDVKRCKECGRINPLTAIKCIGCDEDKFDLIDLNPQWIKGQEDE